MITSKVSIGTCGVVGDLHRPVRGDVLAGLLVELVVEGLAAQDRVHPLDGGDVDLGDRVEPVRGQVLDVVQLGELAAVVGGVEALELLERLPAQVGPVDQEQDPAGPGVADQPVGDVGGGEGLARPGRHLDQRPGVVALEAGLEVLDRRHLGGPQPLGVQVGEELDARLGGARSRC